jgi:integrase
MGSVYKRGRTYWIKYYKDGRPFRESSGSDSQADAERLLKRRQGEIVTGVFSGLAPERIRFRELTAAVVEDYRDNGRKTVDDVESRLKLHLLPMLGDVRAVDFGTNNLKRYVTARKAAGATNGTINRELAIVKRAFRLAAESDPPRVARVPKIRLLREDNVRKGFLGEADYRKLRDALPEELRPLLVVAYYTGARSSELKGLRWEQADLVAKRITLHPGETKNKDGRSLPIYGEMLAWLQMAKAARDESFPTCRWVFHRKGSQIKSIQATWRKVTEACGLEGLLFHDLRRTAVRNMVRAGIPEKVAMQITGHKTRAIFDRYNIVSDRDLSEAAAKMERREKLMGTISGTKATETESKAEGKSDLSRLN